jgi:hypothetical protein
MKSPHLFVLSIVKFVTRKEQAAGRFKYNARLPVLTSGLGGNPKQVKN